MKFVPTVVLSLISSIRKPGISRRLAIGYVTTIGIAALSNQSGQFFADRWVKQPAQLQMTASSQMASELIDLQKTFLENKSMVIAYLKRPELVLDYGYHLQNRAGELQQTIESLHTADRNPNEQLTLRNELNLFLAACRNVGSQYENRLTDLLARLESHTPSGLETDLLSKRYVQTSLLDFMSSDAMVQLESCSLTLESIIAQTQDEAIRSGLALEDAKSLQASLTYISLGVSLLVAIALSLYNSWIITRPLAAVSKVAQQVSEQSNFDLQAPVHMDDEVGVVAQSLNNLIVQVKQLLIEQQQSQQQLETYNQTLESTVQARTQELHTQNQNLQETLETLNDTQAQLVQSEKMSSLGQLVAGIAHEINNPVSFIHGNLQHTNRYVQDLLEVISLYRQHSQPPADVQERIEEIDLDFLEEDIKKLTQSMRMGTERIREIVLSLRNFSRLDESDSKTIDIHEGIDSTLLILGHRLKSDGTAPAIKIEKRYGDVPEINCFPGPLNQVLMNILANAIDALEDNRPLLTEAENQTSAETSACQLPLIVIETQRITRDRIQLIISDNGPGIPGTIREKIFEPFFTTKDVGKGTGMGLSISYKIITEKHKGTLRCESVEGEGTTFVIELPIRIFQAAEKMPTLASV
ncbi:MAG: ATP-binding protein [Cyanobacteria bacterium J06650_10]